MMTQAEFYKAMHEAHTEERNDANRYMELARNAPTQPIRDMLYEIAREEVMHQAKIACMIMTLEGALP